MIDISRNTSDTLRALAIIAIILNHTILPIESLGREGVFIFLFLSGYGIARKYGLANIEAAGYLRRRIERVAVPYWVVLTVYAAIATFIVPTNFVYTNWLLELGLNYLLIAFKPLDLISIGWFVTYILLWYLYYLGVSRLPLAQNAKLGALFLVAPVLFIASPYIVAAMFSITPIFEPAAFHYLYIPYALGFPLGALAALWKPGEKSEVKLEVRALLPVGKYSYWLYLVHVPLLHLMLALGIIHM